MKKSGNILFIIAAIGMLACVLLSLLHIPSRNVRLVTYIVSLAGSVLYLAYSNSKAKKYTFLQVLFTNLFWVGIILILSGAIARHFYHHISKILLVPGYAMMMAALIYIAVVMIADKLRINPKGKPVLPEALSGFDISVSDLDQYIGVYDNDKIPLKITITEDKNTLIAQATNQAAYYLQIVEKNVFKYPTKQDIILEFDLEKNELTLKQHGGYFPFVKEA